MMHENNRVGVGVVQTAAIGGSGGQKREFPPRMLAIASEASITVSFEPADGIGGEAVGPSSGRRKAKADARSSSAIGGSTPIAELPW